MLEIVSNAFPVLVASMVCAAEVVPTAWLLNVRLVGFSVSIPVGFPVPVKFATCGLPGAESTISTEAVRVPDAVGVKVTVIVHFTPGGSEVPQSLVCAKSPESAQTIWTVVIVSGASPLSRVIVWGWLVVLRSWGAKVRPAGLSAIPRDTITLETNASQFPPGVNWAGFESGKSVEQVCPAT